VGSPMWLAYTLSRRGKHFWYAGDWSQARVDFERALAIERDIGGSWNTPHALLDLGSLWLATERQAEGIHYLDEAVTLAQQWHDLQALRLAQPALAEYDLLEGRPQAALGRLLPLLDRPDHHEIPVTRFLALLAWAYLALEDMTPAATTVSECLARARACHLRPTLVDALRVQALVAMQHQQWQTAEDALEE